MSIIKGQSSSPNKNEVDSCQARPESKHTEVDPESNSSEAQKSAFIQAGKGFKISGLGDDQPVPLGVPLNIESEIFKGKVMMRFRYSKSDDPKSHSKYFERRKRLMQGVLQGRFKRPLKMSEFYTGSIFAQPLAAAPSPRIAKIIEGIFRRIVPGLIMDLTSEAPRVIALFAGACQTMSIDPPGEEPDITLPVIEENVASVLGESVATRSKRVKILGNPKTAASFEYNTEDVYTFHVYDDVVDYGRGTMRIPMFGECDIKSAVGPQPLNLTSVTKSGEVVYDFHVCHDSNHIDS